MPSRFINDPQIERMTNFSGRDMDTLIRERAAEIAAWAMKAEIDIEFGGDPADVERELVAVHSSIEADYWAAVNKLRNTPSLSDPEPATAKLHATRPTVDQAVGQAALRQPALKAAPLAPTPSDIRFEPFRSDSPVQDAPATRVTTTSIAPAHAPAKPTPADRVPLQDMPPDTKERGQLVMVEDFEDIFARFQTPLVNFAYRLVSNHEEASDVAQDALLKAFRALANGTKVYEGGLSSWLYRITSNTATDLLRHRKLILWLPMSIFNEDRVGADMAGKLQADPDAGRDTSAYSTHMSSTDVMADYDGSRFEQRVATQELVMRVLNRLTEDERTAILLFDHEGFTAEQLAQLFGSTPDAFKMRLMRARNHFIELYNYESGEQRQRVRRKGPTPSREEQQQTAAG